MAATADRMREIGKTSADVRRARGKLRIDLKMLPLAESRSVVADVIESNGEKFTGMRVDELLLLVGKVSAMRCLVTAHVAPYRTVGELTDRQRVLICEQLRGDE